MKIERVLPYRKADAFILHQDFAEPWSEIERIITEAPVPLLASDKEPKQGGVKRRERKKLKDGAGPRYFFLPVDQKALNKHLDKAFADADWKPQPLVAEGEGGPKTRLKGDFKKGRMQVEVQFGNMARWYTDVFKFQLGYARDEIDVGVLIVPTQRFANLIDENVAYFERIERELPWARMSLTLPILVLGVEPEDFAPIRARYEAAAELLVRKKAEKGETVVPIPYDDRISEEPVDQEQEEESEE